MSGLFAHRIGFSRILPSDIEIHPSSNYSIPIGVKLLPEYFRDQGYETHGAGKWNIGHCNDAYLPMARGFDSFVGYFSGGINYVTHLTKDGHVDLFAATESLFERVTDLRFSDEIFEERALSVIEEAVRPLFLWVAFQCPHDNEGFIKMSPRDAFEEGVRLTDARVGAVVDAVKKKKVRRRGDYLVVVHSDNGAYPCGVNLAGTSYPLRGCKFNYFQGGIRVPAIVAGSALPASARGTEYPNLAHHVDWLATLLAVAGGTLDDDDETSSVNHWPFLQNEILNINRRALLYVGLGDTYAVAIRDDGIKLLHGVYNNSDYYDPDINYSGEQSCIGSAPPLLLRPTWLFNLTTDPLERDNLATNPEYAPLVDAVLRLAMDENRRNSYKPLLHFGEEPLSALAPVFQRSANFVGPFNCSLNYYLH
ncbi:hypothetical protein CTAYLR_000631 [Chrysophaeum taylorii]|uniref:Sulfatase N-terminal domain-containing protein n=1 Tax=Chrysophaeum taylorii TaxID=2483200 RepID=A0AAD7UAD1_9STRA|nr:hypothetical protein CTAYLR_000631 [Chrysophaeum taylorii]